MAKPLSPQEIEKVKVFPDAVLESVNKLIIKNYNGRKSAIFTQTELMNLILMHPDSVKNNWDKSYFFDNHLLDFENLYEKAGWKVEYDKPAYNESYEATFKFTMK